ncbi:hypothetical protein [Eubacterium sp.]
MGKVVTLKDKNGENVYPSTFSTLIYDNNGKSIDSALDGLRSNISTNTSDEGKSIVINDGCNHGKMSISVKGNSVQNSKKGIQLFNVNDKLTLTPSSFSSIYDIDEDGVITANIPLSDTGTYYNFFTNPSLLLKTNKEYNAIIEIVSNPLNIKVTAVSVQESVLGQFISSAASTRVGTNIIKVTTSDDFLKAKTMCRGYIYVPENVSGTIKFRISIIEDTSVTINNFKYESFTNKTVTPNPEYQEDIISCDNLTLYVSGKNLFNLNNVMATTYPRIGVKGSLLLNNSEIQFTTIRNDVYYGSTFTTGNTPVHPNIALTPVSPNTTYSFYLSNQELNKNFVSFFGSDKIAITPYTEFKTSQFSFTTPSDCYYVHIRFGKGDAVIGQTYSTKVMFMQGDKITDFEFYKEPQTLKIPYVLRGIGNIKDEITISDSKVEYIQRIAEETVTLNGLSETSDYAGRYVVQNKIKNQYKVASYGNFCTSAKYKSWAIPPSQTEWVISTSNRAVYISPPLTSEYTADTLNAYLSDKPITLIGCLETPITTDITDTEFGQSLLKLYCNSPTTTIYSDSNADLMATYEISTNNYFSNKLAELKTKLGGV